ncbi:MAG: hypothetical protein JWM04_956 [Verrucomicrobiales bacterium]|nr:hypothetical protein [Verrucomicrobiales bacterium]
MIRSMGNRVSKTWVLSRLRAQKGKAVCDFTFREDHMNDLIFVGVIVAFFIFSGLYVRFCEKL